jgi:hypothetical protein
MSSLGFHGWRFQKSGLHVSQILPMTLALQVQSDPFGTVAQPPFAKKSSVTPSGLQLHSSHSG